MFLYWPDFITDRGHGSARVGQTWYTGKCMATPGLHFRLSPVRGSRVEWWFLSGAGESLARSVQTFAGEAEARANIARVKKSMASARYARVEGP